MRDWHRKTFADAIEQLDSDAARGLANDLVASRQAEHGPNELVETGGRGPWRILWEQLSGAMVLMLIVAAGVSAFLHEYTDAVVILAIVVLNAALGLVQDYRTWSSDSSVEVHWRTIVFTVLTLSQMGNALAIRSSRDSLFRIGVFSNKALISSVALTFGLQMAVVYWPPLQDIFKTTALTVSELVVCIVLSTIVFWAVETHKWYLRSRSEIV